MNEININKQGVWTANQFSEYLISPHDNTIIVEPDGSLWTHIFHHNNPASNLFASTDDFTKALYKNENAWFDFSLCNYTDKWEFLVIQSATSGANEIKIRWSQPVNPMIATFAEVAKANITNITGSGYVTSTWGGLYHKGGNTYLCANNNTEGNWWGATGSWSLHQSGIPAFYGQVVTTGYYDIYLRIDNLTNTKTTITKGLTLTTNCFYEY